jgi:DNA polymerase-3 subunit delta
MDAQAFLTAAERGQLPPVALVHGDAQLADDALAAATRALFPDASVVAFGREVLDGRETSAETVVRSAMTLPLMTATRLVAVRHAEALGARDAPVVQAYARNPNPSSCLLLLADESLETGRDRKPHWLLAAVPASGIVTVPQRRERGLSDWLRQRAAAEGLAVSDEAARLLVEWVGDDAAALLGEVRKAALAGGSANRTVGVKEVEAVVGEHRVAEVFALSRAIERRDVGQALRTLERVLQTEEPLRVLGLLTSEARVAWTIHDLASRGQSEDAVARAVRRPGYVVRARLAALKGATATGLRATLERCWEVERRLKSGGNAEPELAVLVAELCAGPG